MSENRMWQAMVAVAVVSSMLAGASPASCDEKSETKPAKKRHPAIGVVLGTLAGLGVGTIVATQMNCYDDCSGAIAVFFGGGILGALGGYAVAGGFAGDSEKALNEGRARVREALALRQRQGPPGEAVAVADSACGVAAWSVSPGWS